jgi:predicted Zn-dependent protease
MTTFPHAPGYKWPLGPIKVRVEAGPYQAPAMEAMAAWNEVLAPYGARFTLSVKTRKQAKPRNGEGESTIYLTTDTKFWADCSRRTRGWTIIESDIRINPDRFKPLTADRAKIILIHELGHTLGFEHHDGPEDSVLHTKLPLRITGITAFDRAAVAALYGKAATTASLKKQLVAARKIANARQRTLKVAELQKKLAEL